MTVEYLPEAEKQLAKLDKSVQKRIKKYMDEVSNLQDPRSRGKALSSNLAGLWRYRVGDFRIICQIKDSQLIITVIHLGNRKQVYKIF